MLKFGYPATLIAETSDWCLLARPHQATLGALVLVCREPATAFGDVSAQGFATLGRLVGQIEPMLKQFVTYDKINYLMLMMVDPDVHFHILPRYDGARTFGKLAISDAGWPGPPDLGQGPTPDAAQMADLVTALKTLWPGS